MLVLLLCGCAGWQFMHWKEDTQAQAHNHVPTSMCSHTHTHTHRSPTHPTSQAAPVQTEAPLTHTPSHKHKFHTHIPTHTHTQVTHPPYITSSTSANGSSSPSLPLSPDPTHITHNTCNTTTTNRIHVADVMASLRAAFSRAALCARDARIAQQPSVKLCVGGEGVALPACHLFGEFLMGGLFCFALCECIWPRR